MDLRRATSAAYYALFHGINRYVAWSALPGAVEEDWLRLTRSIGHQSIRDVATWVAEGRGPEHLRPLLQVCSSDTELSRLADTFLAAQQDRHRADYDHLWSVSKPTVVSQIQAVQEALDSMTALHLTLPFHIFSTAVLLKSTPR